MVFAMNLLDFVFLQRIRDIMMLSFESPEIISLLLDWWDISVLGVINMLLGFLMFDRRKVAMVSVISSNVVLGVLNGWKISMFRVVGVLAVFRMRH